MTSVLRSGGKTRVLYIAGAGRSGSTLLAAMLGQIPGFFAAGELKYVWDRNVLKDGYCGCGLNFKSCPIWLEISAAVGMDFSNSHPIRPLLDQFRSRAAAQMLMPGARERTLSRFQEGAHWLAAFYSAITSATDSRIVVDSSKVPPYGALLDALPALDVSVIHLVRDPRAVAHSWMRKTEIPSPGGTKFMPVLHPANSALRWLVENAATESYWAGSRRRYLLLRYEDLVSEPERWIATIQAWLGLPSRRFHLAKPGLLELRATHTTSGNPSRFRTGLVPLRPDNTWRFAMPRYARTLVTTITWPFLLRYRYPLDRGNAHDGRGANLEADTTR